jgi:ribosomal protein L28
MGVIDSSVFEGSKSKERARTSREWNTNILSLRLHLEEKRVFDHFSFA